MPRNLKNRVFLSLKFKEFLGENPPDPPSAYATVPCATRLSYHGICTILRAIRTIYVIRKGPISHGSNQLIQCWRSKFRSKVQGYMWDRRISQRSSVDLIGQCHGYRHVTYDNHFQTILEPRRVRWTLIPGSTRWPLAKKIHVSQGNLELQFSSVQKCLFIVE